MRNFHIYILHIPHRDRERDRDRIYLPPLHPPPPVQNVLQVPTCTEGIASTGQWGWKGEGGGSKIVPISAAAWAP
jgi:hypothetical protein